MLLLFIKRHVLERMYGFVLVNKYNFSAIFVYISLSAIERIVESFANVKSFTACRWGIRNGGCKAKSVATPTLHLSKTPKVLRRTLTNTIKAPKIARQAF